MKENLCRAVCVRAISSMVVIDGSLYMLYIHEAARETIMSMHKNTQALQDWQDQGQDISQITLTF